MILRGITLQNFRSYEQQTFLFDQLTTVIVGPNTAGKTNLLEAIHVLSSGKSFRAEKDEVLIKTLEDMGRVKGKVTDVKEESNDLEVILSRGTIEGVTQQ